MQVASRNADGQSKAVIVTTDTSDWLLRLRYDLRFVCCVYVDGSLNF